MKKYEVTMSIEFFGEIEAESAEEAEKLAWTSWGDNSDAPITYSCVEDIQVEELEEDDDDEEVEED